MEGLQAKLEQRGIGKAIAPVVRQAETPMHGHLSSGLITSAQLAAQHWRGLPIPAMNKGIMEQRG